MTGRIILLNGTSSAGKSTLAAAVQRALPDPWFVVDIDGFLSGRPTTHPGWASADVQDRLYRGFHAAIAAFADAGTDVILATILPWHDETVMARMARTLARFDVLFVGVRCPLDAAEDRERQRPSVPPGTARMQFDHVHRYGPYDVEVDTSADSPEVAAARVIDVTDRRAFRELAKRLNT